MATNAITISNAGTIPTPSRTSVPLVHGDDLRILTDGSKAVLYFSPALAKVLSPAPAAVVDLDGGTTLTFAVTSSTAGAYHVLIGKEGGTPPAQFAAEQSNHVYFSPVFHSGDASFPVHSGASGNDNN